ncbi:flagellar basal body-associated FliL family protein [Frigidibacter sp.]|uniref:flagellar basal body-associated FliL family protein n=1 Tax=Frigidibacter sp. TaxID=2586418 RepID=UPI002736DB64|nr:flagellar basal body-associated FliL family protein [Frigidibacter sp.]MDP3341320.1 flagellar basal body-associated FliL family protein [Frigidibacter sp.]
MLRKLLPILLALFGLGAGLGAGIALKPEPDPHAAEDVCAPPATAETAAKAEGEEAPSRDYVKMNNQFVVPVVEGGRVTALVILSISLEVQLATGELVYQREPKLRDGFLQVLFDHANAGGFRGAFTEANNMTVLRHALLEVAQKSLGPIVSDVLIVDIVRQDS